MTPRRLFIYTAWCGIDLTFLSSRLFTHVLVEANAASLQTQLGSTARWLRHHLWLAQMASLNPPVRLATALAAHSRL